MTIKVGDKVPEVTLKWLTADGMAEVNTAEFFKGRTVVLFSVPGAYTPTCSKEHLPGFVARAEDIKAKGVDEIVCLAVNDPFVMQAWGKEQGADGKVTMLPDGNGEFTKAMGLTQDISVAGLGVRGKRFSMRVKDGVVETLGIEEGKGVTVSGADQCMVSLS
ncbi:peroxiredoxin [Paraliomyxa miuraensis]|uniref:peroxiredoxin n=1 Tax=Paraliomyxa miuraensis TaxID=376150 RepID=UPI00224F886D|nr:peroxiredoxin [Paraliomyxa miuraensis]MCX4240586.1 peroxiredoxin [Paraliomyxa miuraensis]